jgi:hypothetical protein
LKNYKENYFYINVLVLEYEAEVKDMLYGLEKCKVLIVEAQL